MNKTLATLATVAVLALLVSSLLGMRWKAEAGEKGAALLEAQTRYTEDSTGFVNRMQQLGDSLAAQTHVGDSLTKALGVYREAMPAALGTIRSLIASQPAAAQPALNTAVDVVIQAGNTCDATVANCETRAATSHQRELEALAQLQKSDSLRGATTVRWQDAEKRAAPSFFRDLARAKAIVVPALVVTGVCLLRK